MPSNIPDDNVPLEHLIDEEALREKYQRALEDGASPDFARSFVEEVARTMMVEEALTLSLRPEALRRALDRTVFTGK